MNQPLIDNLLLLGAFISAVLIVKPSRGRRMHLLPSFFLLFAPFIIFLNMWAHTFAVLIVNYKRYLSGTFEYGFHFYSLILFGIVFIGVSGIQIHYTRKLISGHQAHKRKIHTLNIITASLFLPLFFVNPLGLLPVIASVISSLTLVLAKVKHHEDLEVYSTAISK